MSVTTKCNISVIKNMTLANFRFATSKVNNRISRNVSSEITLYTFLLEFSRLLTNSSLNGCWAEYSI
jgi:hypothetical protein